MQFQERYFAKCSVFSKFLKINCSSGMCEMVIVKDEPEIHWKQRRRLGGSYVDEQ